MGAVARVGILGIDSVLRRYYLVAEFTAEEGCILRIAPAKAKKDLQLSDGTQVRAGDPILALHLWNEHLPKIPREGPGLQWGAAFYRRMRHSLQQLADYLDSEPRFRNLASLGGDIALTNRDWEPVADIMQRAGFDLVGIRTPRLSLWPNRTFWDNLFSWWLMWAFNPGSLQRKDFGRLVRCEFWISRKTLIEKYGKDQRR